jgi:beta-glucanase (GH16 family)
MNLSLPIALSCIALSAALAGESTSTPPTLPGWKLVWNDEFDGPEIDRKKWDFDIGNGNIPGWGNNELEYYTDRPENAYIKDGMLHIQARKEAFKNFKYTSARLKTRKEDKSSLFAKLYGRFEFRAKVSTGKGIWPALWLLPQDEKYKGWAASGEIDILEARGQEPGKVLGTLHYGSGWPANTHSGKDFVFPDNGTIADFHSYALEWEPGEIRWLVDGKVYQTQNFWWSSSKRTNKGGAKPESETELNPWPAPFDQTFFIIMNVAVGGNFLGNPDTKTVFPAEMVIDYVRVYDKADGYGAAKPRGEGNLPFKK